MKKTLLAIFLVFVFTNINAEEWKEATTASFGVLSQVFFLNENTGWMVGSKGTILKTTDGGNSWTYALSENFNIPNTLYSVNFIDENIGYFGGSNNLLLKTTDGGSTIDTITFPADSKSIIKAIHFINENKGWVLSTQTKSGKVYYTSDGGANWTVQINEDKSDLEDIHFYSSAKAICVGGNKNSLAIYSTSDGMNWTKSSMPSFPISYSKLDLHGVFLLNETTAIIVGYGTSSVGLQPSIILKSTDGGINWTYMEQAETNRIYTNLYDVSFKDETNGLAIGGDATNGYVAYRTTDAGTNWEKSSFPFGFTPKSIYSIGNKVWVAGSSGGSAYSTDFGTTWKLSTDIPASTLFALQFVNNKIAYAGGYGGLLLKTEDGGLSWKADYVPSEKLSPSIESIDFVNENVGYLARKNRLVSKTVDGGNSWTSVLPDTNWNKTTLYGIDFLNENFGIAVGKFGTGVSALYKTIDGGSSWQYNIGTFNEQLSDVCLIDENNAVVVGRNKIISYSTDGGNTWLASSLNNVPSSVTGFNFNEVKFLNNNLGLAAGKILMKTNDGGKNWNYVGIPILTKEIHSCAFADEQTWYVAGSKFVFKTTDGGNNWIDISDTNTIAKNASLSSITVDTDGYPWVAGGTSKIYTLAPLTNVENKQPVIANNFRLEQNYPNPFNPTTTIEYTIPMGNTLHATPQPVQLKIYDMLGREVATLVNEQKQPGNYTITFDGSNLSSGVYYYQLKTRGFIMTKKMLLLQ